MNDNDTIKKMLDDNTNKLLHSELACSYLHDALGLSNWTVPAFDIGYSPSTKELLFPIRNCLTGLFIHYTKLNIAMIGDRDYKDYYSPFYFGLWELLHGHFIQGEFKPGVSDLYITETEVEAIRLICEGKFAIAVNDNFTKLNANVHNMRILMRILRDNGINDNIYFVNENGYDKCLDKLLNSLYSSKGVLEYEV